MSKDVLKGKTFLKAPGHFIDEATEQVEEVKRRHSIVSLFEGYGVKLAKTSYNGSYTGLCPWHDDHNPSLSVDDTKGLYHCFGCDAKGDIIELVRKMENVSFREAMKKLEGRIDSSSAAPNRKQTTDKVVAPEEEGATTSPLIALTDVAAYYHNRLFESKDAVQYLIKRGITNTGLYERFTLGFADGSILSKLSDKQQESLKASGILSKKNVEHFHNCVIFPILDPSTSSGQVSDRVVGLYGRRIMEDDPRHLYLPGPHRGIWNRKASKVYDEIVLVESIIDALSLVQIGVENVQPLYGTNGFTAEHIGTLKDDNVKTVVLALDNDEAGHKASESLKAKLLDERFTVKTIFPKLSKDWNEELVAGLEKETFRLLIEEAKPEKKQESVKSFEITREGIKDIFRTEYTCPERSRGITYEIVGAKELFVTNLRVNVKAIYGGESYYDNADLASGRSRRGLSETLAQLFSIEYRIVERDLMRILDYYASERDRKLAELSTTGEKKEITAEERELGLAFLKNPDMFNEIVRDMDTLGYVGEDLNKILLYLAASSRILDDPISVMILSQSAAGKSMLVSTLKKLIPAEDVISLTSLSDQALNYIASMLHKFLDLGEAVHSETIEHQIRDMLSAKELSRLVTIKDEKTGQMRSELKRTPAIVAAVMTTTRQNINPENASRFFVINTDETKEQTRRIHAVQREKYTLARYTEKAGIVPHIVKKHHAAQRLLKKVAIVNNFSGHLDFPDTLMRVRRDHERFIDLIACVCFLRQYQKEIKNNGSTSLTTGSGLEYIECDLDDYSIAYKIMINGVLASTMIELPKSANELYEAIRVYAREASTKKHLKPEEVSFTQRDIREQTGYGQTWIKMNMRLLVDYEYLVVSRGGRERSKAVYRLREDENISKINLSMIPTPEEMKNCISAESELQPCKDS
jgi:DNA primase catalytic core